ncbi:hypothetical protein [Algoriella sp.]|uniref:hypothetical protein n=1 Tax=Algoriella sp. TaxID=1872434 RepID=UPI002FCB269E
MSSCIKKINLKIITLSDKRGGRSKFILNNNNQIEIQRIEVDGCYIKQGKRCDYILSTENFDFLVELKGEGIKSGIEQLEDTIHKFYVGDSKSKRGKKAIIVATKTSPSTRSAIKTAKAKFKKYNSSLEVKNLIFETSI